jgi:hypothetical protein
MRQTRYHTTKHSAAYRNFIIIRQYRKSMQWSSLGININGTVKGEVGCHPRSTAARVATSTG